MTPCKTLGDDSNAYRRMVRELADNFLRKDMNMNPNDVTIKVGNQTYRAREVEFHQCCGEYPEIELSTMLSPYNRVSSNTSTKTPTITNVIFNPPATIVFWSDKTKTVVKCDYSQEMYDPEKGLAMAFSKKLMGENKYEYYNVFKHWLKKWNKQKLDQGKTQTENNTEWTWNGEMYDA